MLAVESFGQARFSKIPFYRLADDKRSVRLTHGGFSDGGPSISLSRHRGCLPTRVFFVFFSTVISSQFLRLPRRARLRSLSPGFDASPLQKHLGEVSCGLQKQPVRNCCASASKGLHPTAFFPATGCRADFPPRGEAEVEQTSPVSLPNRPPATWPSAPS